ncbi:proline racemase family protein [uncultured Desulfuromusa sp.]|uniref:proline racemase family protein n=1 Tax=uncultured Desulfuromusa sp. TaxID=219183 RepID=UPI002AA722C0|nr:proline racemase family protein [uncultured Desulfuromusa sp.]
MNFFADFSCNVQPFGACITAIDSHTEGEATRLIVNGLPEPEGRTMLEKLISFKTNYDHVRCLLTKEPRGSRDTVAALVTKNVSPEAKFGLLYMDAKRYPYLCGHATIGALVTLSKIGFLSLEEGENLVLVDTPSGVIHGKLSVVDGQLTQVSIDMVPSFVYATAQNIEVESFGCIQVDLVCIGGFFAMVDTTQLGIEPVFANRDLLTKLGMEIIQAANKQLSVAHPLRPEVKTVDVTEFYDSKYEQGKAFGQGIVVYGESHVDRSPCGTGTAAKLTLLHHYGKITMGQNYTNYGPLRTSFAAKLISKEKIGSLQGCIVQITGMAYLTGLNHFILEDNDPLQLGFLL